MEKLWILVDVQLDTRRSSSSACERVGCEVLDEAVGVGSDACTSSALIVREEISSDTSDTVVICDNEASSFRVELDMGRITPSSFKTCFFGLVAFVLVAFLTSVRIDFSFSFFLSTFESKQTISDPISDPVFDPFFPSSLLAGVDGTLMRSFDSLLVNGARLAVAVAAFGLIGVTLSLVVTQSLTRSASCLVGVKICSSRYRDTMPCLSAPRPQDKLS